MNSFYHLCFAVQDIERAMMDLTATMGVAWGEVGDGQLAGWDYRIVFSTDGPPFFELIEGPDGSPWDATGGSRFDHLGYWSADLPGDREYLADRGAPVSFDACPYGRGFLYHHLPSIGANIELVDAAKQPDFIETWCPGGSMMSTFTRPD